MLNQEIDVLKLKLEEQILNNVSYSDIYETSVEIDKLLVDYYEKYHLGKQANTTD